ncbi:MAG: hypothetical protein LBD09_05240 [Treponema sp.]|nr:hypothetical protein [Treponema sp.]
MRAWSLVALLFLAGLCPAQEAGPGSAASSVAPVPDTPAGIITGIEVIGLKRTRPHIARYPLERFLGRDASLDLNEVEAAVRDTGILEPVSVELTGSPQTPGGLVLRVTVEEKWSIFPMPLVLAGSGGTGFGLFVADTNAFGLRDQAALGGMYGSTGWTAIAMYNLTPDRRGPPGLTGMFMYNRGERKDLDRNEGVHRRYTGEILQGSLRAYYPLYHGLTASAALSFRSVSLPDPAGALNAPLDGARHLGLGPGLELRYTYWDGYLLSQQSLSLKFTYQLALRGTSFHQTELTGIYQRPILPGFLVSFKTGAAWNSGDDPLFEEGPQKAQVDILPRNFSARHYAGFSLGLEKYIFKARYGTLSALASWQGVFSRGPIGGDQFDHGPSGGIRFYLSRLAIPALGAGLAWNMNSGVFQFTFNLGMGF